jgi:hypothetical protein
MKVLLRTLMRTRVTNVRADTVPDLNLLGRNRAAVAAGDFKGFAEIILPGRPSLIQAHLYLTACLDCSAVNLRPAP